MRIVLIGILALGLQSANAGTIDFESPATSDCFSSTCTAQGFDWLFNAGGWGIVTDHTNSFFNFDSSQGMLGAYLNTPTTVTMTPTGGGTFAISDLDAASGNPATVGTTSILVTGNLSGGGTVSQTLTASAVWANYVLTGFTNLTSVVFSNDTSAGLSLDNINTGGGAAVPEPSSLALLALGAAGLLLGRKRFKSLKIYPTCTRP